MARWLGWGVGLVVAGGAWGTSVHGVSHRETPPATQEASGQDLESRNRAALDAMDALEAEFERKLIAYQKAMEAATTDEQRASAAGLVPSFEEYTSGCRAVALKYPGTDGACRAWVEVFKAPGTEKGAILDLLLESHLDSVWLADGCFVMGGLGDPQRTAFLETVREESPHAKVTAQASLSLARSLWEQAEVHRAVTRDSKKVEFYLQVYGEDVVEWVRALDAADAEARSLDLFAEVAEGDPALENHSGSIAEQAQAELFERTALQIGQLAPDIEGEDLDGVPFKLSDYRGKVVVLDFWGDW